MFGEAMDLLHAINWMHGLQLVNVDFEFDTKIAVDYFNNRQPNITEFGSILDECIIVEIYFSQTLISSLVEDKRMRWLYIS
jgi:hypothetical protein